MADISLDEDLERFRQLNDDFNQALGRLQKSGMHTINQSWFANLRAHLSQARTCLRSPDSNRPLSTSFQAEILRYRGHLRQLAEILPVAHGYLLAEKARLQNARERQQRLQLWADAQQGGS